MRHAFVQLRLRNLFTPLSEQYRWQKIAVWMKRLGQIPSSSIHSYVHTLHAVIYFTQVSLCIRVKPITLHGRLTLCKTHATPGFQPCAFAPSAPLPGVNQLIQVIHGLIHRPLPSTGRLSGGSGALCFSAFAQESAEERNRSVRLNVRRTPKRCYSIRQGSRPHELPTSIIHKRATRHRKKMQNLRTRSRRNPFQ